MSHALSSPRARRRWAGCLGKGPPERGAAPVTLHMFLGQEGRDHHSSTAHSNETSLLSSAFLLHFRSTWSLNAVSEHSPLDL